jgi:uncharacterized protein
MTTQIVFLQGAGTDGYEEDRKIVSALQAALGTEYEVRYPPMPDADNPDHRAWTGRIVEELDATEGDPIVVAHSLGGSTVLKALSEAQVERPLVGLFLLALPFWGKDEDWQAEYALRDDFAQTLPPIPHLFFYHCRDDETVPFAHLALYAEALPQATIRPLEHGGHQFEDNLAQVVADIHATTHSQAHPR